MTFERADLHADRLRQRRALCRLARRAPRVRGRSRLVRGPLAGDRLGSCRPAAGYVQGHAPEARLRGQERARARSRPGQPPYQFRLLSDGLLGYAWPKWVKAGEKSEFRVHSVEPYQLSLWRYGFKKELIRSLGWFDEHGPRATMQITPDGDYTQTGVAWNKFGYANPAPASVRRGPRAVGPVLFPRPHGPGGRVRLPLDRRAGNGRPRPWRCWPRTSPGTRTTTSAAAATTSTPTACRRRPRSTPGSSSSATPIPTAITYDTDDYAPLSFDRPEPINHIDLDTEITDPIEGRAACHLAPAEWRLLGWLEREQFRLRLLRRDPAPRRHARPGRLPGPDHLDASGILVADDVLRGQVVGSRARRQAHVPGRQRPELRGRVRRCRRP